MKKLRHTNGMTLVEALLTVLILSILGTLAVTGSKAVRRSFHAMEGQYEARLLAEKLLAFLADEFHYARWLQILPEADGRNGSQVAYDSAAYGYPTLLKLESLGEPWEYGAFAITPGHGGTKIVPFRSSYSPLWLCPLDEETPVFRWSEDEGCIVVSFGVCNEDGEIQAAIQDYYIRNLNGE